MSSRRVLVSGAGPAGLAVSTYLARAGHEVTLVERAAALRTDGYAVDLRGEALAVAADLGVLDDLRDASTRMGPTLVLDDTGQVVSELPVERFSGDLEVPKKDLVDILAAALPDAVDLRLGDSLAELRRDGTGARAAFERGRATSYDVVVGADGVRSVTRRLAFGPDSAYVRDLGLCGVGFTSENHLGLDHQGVLRPGPGRAVYAFSSRDRTRMTVSLTCAVSASGDDVEATVRAAFADDTWQVPTLLTAMGAACDRYTATTQQVVMPTWSRGPVTLLGDAACCAAPTSGTGTSQALVGARSLAAALGAEDLDLALAEHEAALRPWVEANQAAGLEAALELGAPQVSTPLAP